MSVSRPYEKPSLMAQMGLKPDPNRLEHVVSPDGNKLTKVHTRGGHPMETQQRGLPTYHRRIANPFPLAAIGIGATLLILGLLLVEVRGLQQLNMFYNIGLPLGGIGVLTASMFGFAVGDTFVAVFAGNLGGLIGSVSLVFLPWTGIQASYIEASVMEGGSMEEGVLALYKALGIVFLIAMIPVFAVFAASFKTAVPVSSGALLIVIALILQGVNLLEYPRLGLQKGAGAIFIAVGVILWYSALSTMLQEEGVHIPYFPLPRQDV